MAHQPLVGHALLIIESSRSHSDTPNSVRLLLWTTYQSDTETYTWQHTTLTRDTHAPRGIRNRNTSKRAAADPREYLDTVR
jgi:hypothetical protein